MQKSSKNYTLRKKNTPQETRKQKELAVRRKRALDLRMAGASFQQIVDANIGYHNTSMVSQDMKHILKNFQYETPEDILILDLARLDELQQYLTMDFRRGERQHANTIMRVMQFRRETLGITPEVIADRRTHQQNVTNNGIMVIQGTPGSYLEQMMEASGASPAEIEAYRTRSEGTSARAELPSGNSSNSRKVRVKVKRKSGAGPAGTAAQPGSTGEQGAGTSTYSQNSPVSAGQEFEGDIILGRELHGNSEEDGRTSDQDFQDRLVEFAREQEARQRLAEQLREVDRDSPLLSVDIVEGKRKMKFRIKHPDANQAAHPGVVWKSAPRKPEIPRERVLWDVLDDETTVEEI